MRIFNDIRIAYIYEQIGDRWREHLAAEQLVVVAAEVHVLYESEGLPGEEYVGAMRYVRREGRAAIIEQRLIEADRGAWRSRGRGSCSSSRATARVVDWPPFYFDARRRGRGPRDRAATELPPAVRSG